MYDILQSANWPTSVVHIPITNYASLQNLPKCWPHPLQLLQWWEIKFQLTKPILCLYVHFNIDQKIRTPFDVTSILEEDIIKVCVRLGHTHPMGVLHYSATESIILFQSADDMQHATCRAIKVTVLHEEAIAVRASAPPKPIWGAVWPQWVGNHLEPKLHPQRERGNLIAHW